MVARLGITLLNGLKGTIAPSTLAAAVNDWSDYTGVSGETVSSSGVQNGNQLKAKRSCFCTEFVFLALLISKLISSVAALVKGLTCGDELVDYSGEFVGSGCNSFGTTEFSPHAAKKVSKCTFVVS